MPDQPSGTALTSSKPGWAKRELDRLPEEAEAIAQFIGALDKHKERIRRLQEALCECSHRDIFQAHLHEGTCPVFVIAEEQRLG